MIGNAIFLLLGVGLGFLTWEMAKAAMKAARETRRAETVLFGLGTMVMAVLAFYAFATGVIWLAGG